MGATCMSARKSEPAPVGRARSSRYQLRVALILSMKEIVTAMGNAIPHRGIRNALIWSSHSRHRMIIALARKGLICVATAGLLVLTMLPGLAQTKKLGDGLTFEGAGASFIGSGQTTTLNAPAAAPTFLAAITRSL